MIILKLRAGLGNQLFQYAYARARALRSGADLTIDTSWFSNIHKKDTPRTFLLDKYNLPASITIAPRPESKLALFMRKALTKISRDFLGQSDYTYYPRLARPVSAARERNTIVEGYWNSEKYFADYADTIRKELALKIPLSDNAAKIEQEVRAAAASGAQTVLIHVRRGDYVTNIHANKFNGLSGVEYYKEAIAEMRKELPSRFPNSPIVFFLASDDVAWLQENIAPLLGGSKYHMISGRAGVTEYEELHVMSQCHHFIIANSTFSWWAAWLSTIAEKTAGANTSNSTAKIVIGPKKWVLNPAVDTRDVLPEEWIKI